MVYIPHLFISSSISFISILQFSEYKSLVSLLLLLSHYVVSNSWDPMDCNPPGSSVHGISQARILKWVATSFSRGSSQPRDRTFISCIGRWIFLPLSHQGSPHEFGGILFNSVGWLSQRTKPYLPVSNIHILKLNGNFIGKNKVLTSNKKQ